jgi:alanyl-tRNA synthetase
MEALKVAKIKELLIDYHKGKGYEIFDSFPILSDDPTLLFVNATITPLKNVFTDPSKKANNFALIQRCFRAGGSQSLKKVGYDPSLTSFFEMFGTGSFGVDYFEAAKHLFDVLELLGIKKSSLYFTVPPGKDFFHALIKNGISSDRIFGIENNKVFWCQWQFGKSGPTGKGLAVIYAKNNKRVLTVDGLREDPDNFIELLNLIHVYGYQSENGRIMPAVNPGFEIGVGVGRIASVLQNCNSYQVDNMEPLVKLVLNFFKKNGYEADIGTCRACTDCLQSMFVLMNEGIISSNKSACYVLRKMIRRLLELVWVLAEKPVDVTMLVESFFNEFCIYHKFNVKEFEYF